jgi:DNA-binding XRE family transcriptional regulator
MKIFSAKKLDEALNSDSLNVAGIARSAGISRQSLSAIRKGDSEPKINTFLAISYVLKKPMSFFLEEEAVVNQTHLALSSTMKEAANG